MKPMTVGVGIAAFGRACSGATFRQANPSAEAVRMQGRSGTSGMAERVKRAITAAPISPIEDTDGTACDRISDPPDGSRRSFTAKTGAPASGPSRRSAP